MALFQRIFSSKRTFKRSSEDRNEQLPKTVPPKLDKSKIRLVIYADSDRGRVPYFDSNAIKLLEDAEKNVIKTAPKAMRAKGLNYSAQKESSLPQQRQTPKYQFHRLGSDVKVLEEMMFGTVAMAFKGSSLKIHLLRSPPQLMVTKVFIPEKPSKDSVVDVESDSSSLPGSSADFSSGEFSLPIRKPKEKFAKSIPVDVPTKDLLSDYSTDDDSGLASFTSSGSLRTPFPSPSNNSLSSYNSLHRRWMRAQTTSLDAHHRQESNLVSENSVTRPRRNKLAIGILFGAQDEKDEESNDLFQSFFFSHFALIEGYVEKLRSVIEKAYFNSRNFLPATMEALENFRNDVYDLYMAPRLREPVWLTMMSTTTYKTKLCEKFMETFVGLVTRFDNKNNKFFVSTLLSAVLTQHLAWVATVTPAGGTPSHTYLDKHTAKWVDTLAKTHPYNPLWAQLGDLFGAIGPSLKIARTVVVGKKAETVKRFLYVLSYFIRCSEVHENSDLQCLNNIVNDTQFDVSLSPTLSEKTLLEGAGMERCASPSASGALLTRQISNGIGDTNYGTTHRAGAMKENHRVNAKHKLKDRMEEEVSDDHVKKIQSEPLLAVGNLAHSHNCCHVQVERSNNEQSILQSNSDRSVVKTECPCGIDANAMDKSASSKHQYTAMPSCANTVMYQNGGQPYLDHVHSDSALFPASTSLTEEPMAMSELHIYPPHSFPTSGISKCNESQSAERVTDIGSSQAGHRATSPGFTTMGAEPILRSQSFSEGKIKSKLSQQLESDTVQTAPDTSKKKATEIRKFFFEGSNSTLDDQTEGVPDDITDADKVMISSTGSASSWFSSEGKKEVEATGKHLISRQASQDSKSHSGRPNTLARCRSITPTELSRRRHLSSTGSIDYEAFDPMIHCKEIKLPEALAETRQWRIRAFDRNFGRSLLADYTDHYMSDFVLHGTSDTDYRSRLLNDLQMTVKHSVLDEPIDEAVCVIADTDNWTVEVASSKVMGISPSGCTSWTSSQLVADLIESVVEISKMKMSAEFCLMHLEDRLQEIYFKSLMLSEYLRDANTYSQRELTAMLGFESSDMPLLLAVAGTHNPSLALGAQ